MAHEEFGRFRQEIRSWIDSHSGEYDAFVEEMNGKSFTGGNVSICWLCVGLRSLWRRRGGVITPESGLLNPAVEFCWRDRALIQDKLYPCAEHCPGPFGKVYCNRMPVLLWGGITKKHALAHASAGEPLFNHKHRVLLVIRKMWGKSSRQKSLTVKLLIC